MIKIRAILSSKPAIRFCQLRHLSQLAARQNENTDERMQAWQIHSYGSLHELKLSTVKMPVLSRPSDILIKVEAASVNPIDVAMIGGYGSKVINLMRKAKSCQGRPYSDIEFPLVMGRDFSGTVVSKGHGVDELKIGDKVWGVVPVEQQGCHADYVIVDSCLVSLRPKNLSYIEAASILYAGLTAWSALWYTGGLCYKTAFATQMNKRVLVLGGSGGVGTLAIQLLKAWNMQVVTTCNTDATDMLQDLGADVVIDYKQQDADSKVIAEGPYNIILDCCNQGAVLVKSKGYPHCNYITLNSPLLKNVDEHGLIFGAVKNLGDLLKHNIPVNEKKSLVKWGFFAPSPSGITHIQELVEHKKIIPVVQEVFPFEELPKAYERVRDGHLRGKIVVDMR
ncbi:reticulon-4-interacting protein 1 homolog, mitochondrial [Nasonia vitripennis]|uniref:Enoyl reductase (ER) domain-containing protein n=1 Tax=Nasonia vitripennis TaxID=7425 RepID=A0A7M7G2E4_NASVI|nr:reticulon-4-interacting protein 1 homolog, mitochondrial [Nasonia vitripennis]